ncbi:hypothetical protein I317_02122 [Kwoniella heveanensis CBS 569]|nr:hypothetical protein I317_02122 [Kwoniella heveanensis CBS 569]
MFWRKKSSSSVDRAGPNNAQAQPVEPPKPILRMNTEGQGAANIRFAGQGSTYKPPTPTSATFPTSEAGQSYNSVPRMGQPQAAMVATTERVRTHPPAPRVIVSSYDTYSPPTHPHPHQRMASFDSSPLNAQPRVTASSRRSSRPTSPSATSFGARIRSRTEPLPAIASSSAPMVSVPLETPPMSSSHVTTPPTAYVSTFQSRAPPPPSPYRPTNERRRSSLTRNLPEQLPMMGDFAPVASNFLSSDSRSSVHTLPGADVPMLNIIPATPVDHGNEFPDAWDGDNTDRRTTPVSTRSLEDAVQLEEMVQVPLEGVPSIDVKLDFSPFEPLAELPDTDTPMHEVTEYFPSQDAIINDDEGMEEYDMDSIDHEHAPSEPLPPSPPFASYPSLPSLASHESIRSSASEDSMPTSSSMSSLVSFPDVEEALGSMLASLSDSSMASTAIQTPTKGQSVAAFESNPGLGLGLDIPDQAASITAPLSPRRRAPPPPLDLSAVKFNSAVERGVAHSAPIINHRVAFYNTAKAHPNSPSSGIFTSSSSLASSASSSSTISLGDNATPAETHHTYRDSISLASEASDEDLCTASIISLTPIMKGKVGARETKEEILGDGEEYSNSFGLGLGLGPTVRNGSGFGQSVLCGLEEDVEVGLAL